MTSIGVIHEHLNAVAVPIRSPRSGTLYGLSASGLTTDWPKEQLMAIGPELVSMARQLTVTAD